MPDEQGPLEQKLEELKVKLASETHAPDEIVALLLAEIDETTERLRSDTQTGDETAP